MSKLLWKKILKCVDPNPYYQRWLYQGILLTVRFPKFGYEVNNQRKSVCDADVKCLQVFIQSITNYFINQSDYIRINFE